MDVKMHIRGMVQVQGRGQGWAGSKVLLSSLAMTVK